ncbi:MAG: T9SS type A sorting domain-containing protein, partial [Bacteroidota bacterium]
GLSYTGSIIAQMGDDASAVVLADGCADLSDGFVTVTRVEADGAIDTGEINPFEVADQNMVFNTELSVSPNPTVGNEVVISITSDLPLMGGRLSVRDLNGQTYQVQTLPQGSASTTVRIDVSELPSGVYFATYVGVGGVESVQFIKP